MKNSTTTQSYLTDAIAYSVCCQVLLLANAITRYFCFSVSLVFMRYGLITAILCGTECICQLHIIYTERRDAK